MISQCANPGCHEPFVYFRSGKLLAVPRREGGLAAATVECFWLCQRCAENLALEFRHGDDSPALVARHETSKATRHLAYKH
jgi:hypothetical protein